MSKFLILLIAAFPLVLASKETKKIVRVCPNPAFSETFYVLKSDTGIRHGSYQAKVAGKLIVSS